MFSHRIDRSLELTLPEPAMAEELTILVRSNLRRLQPWMPWATEDYSVDDAGEFIRRTLNEFAEDGRFSAAIIAEKRLAGIIGFNRLDTANRSACIGYWISEDYEGRGYVTRCTAVLMDYLFDVRDLNRIQINCNVENKRSRAVPERLGFVLEGVHREVEFNNGAFGDWAVYAMLRRDWDGGAHSNTK